ncbi:MAG: PAS domain S-box protein [Candidatus Abyssobacteria bacterium SURF_5]|uniref:histidine kinase n=1 Tax=Abyssobacteria bacterium (strain SURF_5) TaxID=2093360 RepID=A0A3A4N9I2_ABYX5|nr:MAG: PAS domain S-box protein [Candidatus Abyssubacteria bacterium SURF_5]
MQTTVHERNWLNPEPSASLAEAVSAFNDSTQQLQRAYIALQVKFAALNRKLEETNRELNHKVGELSEVKEYLNSILQSVTNGVIAQRPDGTITAFNTAAEKITGLNSADVLGRRYEDVFESPFSMAAPANAAGGAADNRHVTREMKVKRRPAFPVRESTSRTRDSRGRLTGAVKVFEDLSELRDLEEQARRQDRLAALGQMSATVAHEIRNPLGGIEGFASLLARDFDADDPRLKLVTKIQEGARSLNRIVSELLLFTRPMKLNCQEFEVSTLISNVLGYLSEEIKRSRICVHKKPGPKKGKLHGDFEQLKQVLLNIMLNAIQAMPGGGALDIACRRRRLPPGALAALGSCRNGTWLDIGIKDTGPGIDEAKVPLIFNPFYTTKEKGTGLGLAIASKIIEAHNGQIVVTNPPEGGALFTISVPSAG